MAPTEHDRYAELEARFQGVMDAAVDAIIVIDADAHIETFSAAAERIFGYRAEEVLGRNVAMLMPDPDASRHDGYVQRYLAGGPPQIIGRGREVVGRRKDGSTFPMDLAVGEMRGQRTRRFVGIIRDITRRREIEQALAAREAESREARERLTQVARVATLGEMASAIAHEINQPLTAISTYAQACRRMRERGLDEPGLIDETLGMITEQALRAGDVVRRIRGFVSHRESARERHDLNAVLATVLTLGAIDADSHRVAIVTEFAADLPPVLVDPVQIQQVCLNLIRNAVDAMDGLPEAARVLTITTCADDEAVEACFVDRGPGLAADLRAHLFQPFHTTKAEGMGMGLSISNSLVAAHGGELTYADAPTGGAVFTMRLPLAPPV